MVTATWYACDPIEDTSLREKYYENVREPISKADLAAALSITQPIEGKNQYIVIRNSRPDIPGMWHYLTTTGEKTLGTDQDTIVYDANGMYSIWFVGLSANTVVQTDPVSVTVSDFPVEEWDTWLTGANAGNITGYKTWEFWPGSTTNAVYYNGMYANWLVDGTVAAIHNGLNSWGGYTKLEQAGAWTVTFEYIGQKLTVYKPDGTVSATGNYALSHEIPTGGSGTPEKYIIGQLITTTPLPGSTTSWEVLGANPTYWLWLLDGEHMCIVHPVSTWAQGDFWDNSAWYGFYQAKHS
jgi:hypothetical protein